MSILKTALGYAERGIPVLPLRGKIPLTPNGVKDASTDPQRIWRWFSSELLDANVGIATGELSGIIGLDIDGEDGEESLLRLQHEHDDLPHTVEVKTGKGRHLWLRVRQPVGNRVGMADWIDIRGSGGFLVAPPSVHPDTGLRYAFTERSARCLAEAPAWLVEMVAVRPSLTQDWAGVAEIVPEGQRNNTVARLAGKLLRHGIEPDLTLPFLLAVNDARCQPPLPHAEVQRTVASVARKDATRRADERTRSCPKHDRLDAQSPAMRCRAIF